MAEIFLARLWADAGFFRDVVIKRLFDHMAEHERAVRMFQYEARLLAEVCHPNIPQVYELGEVDDTWFMAMEFIDGHTLSDLWRAGARDGRVMPISVALGIVLQICEALHHAHERRDRAGRALRIVHRDVTPHNVMVTRDGVVKLMDFGVAQTAARRDTDAGAVKGTFSYMAPEQVRAMHLDKRADVFATGVILYELTTGTRLFRGNDVQVMTSIVEEDAPPPSARVPNYPAELEEVVMTALARNRSDRLPSASHLARAIEEFALRNGLLVGHRAVSRYVGAIYPYEREMEVDAALVGEDAPVEEDEPTGERAGASDWLEQTILEEEIRLDDDMLSDLNLLDPSRDVPAESLDDETPSFATPAQVLEGLLFEDTTRQDNLPESGGDTGRGASAPLPGFEEGGPDTEARPVVLLDSPKRERSPGRDYLRSLERKLEEEDDD